MSRTVYRVLLNGKCWVVERGVDGSAVRVSERVLRADAVARGRALAIAGRPSRLLIEDGAGMVELEWTYGD